MRRMVLLAVMVAAFLMTAAPAAATGFTAWHASVTGPVLHGGATVTERPAARVRFAALVKDAAPGSRPVMELVNAACGTKGLPPVVARMTPATKGGVSLGLEIFSTPQTAVFDAWVKAGKTISVHVVARGPNVTLTQSCGDLHLVG